jgi:hypothetical protein
MVLTLILLAMLIMFSLISYFNLGKGISIDQALFLPLFLERR